MAKSQKVAVRVLVDMTVGKAVYKPNQVVVLDVRKAKSLYSAGSIDPDEDAVQYCLSEGAVPIEHADDAQDDGDESGGEGGAGGPTEEQ